MKNLNNYILEKNFNSLRITLDDKPVDSRGEELFKLLNMNYTPDNTTVYLNSRPVEVKNIITTLIQYDHALSNYVKDFYGLVESISNEYNKLGYSKSFTKEDFDEFIMMHNIEKNLSKRDLKTLIGELNNIEHNIIEIQPDYLQTFYVAYDKYSFLIIGIIEMDDDMNNIRKVDEIMIMPLK